MNTELQIYMDPFLSHSSNFISASSMDLVSKESPIVNMVTITPISPPCQKTKVSKISFTLMDATYYGEHVPLYIPTKLNV